MAAKIVSGREIARTVRAETAERVTALAQRGVVPGLRVILAGDDPASQVYVRSKGRMSEKVGIDAATIRLPGDLDAETLRAEILRLNEDDAVDGILVQLPLPDHLDWDTQADVLGDIDPAKDVDGLHPLNLGKLVAGEPGFVACTPSGYAHAKGNWR